MVPQKVKKRSLPSFRGNGNPVFSLTWQVLDSRLRGKDNFLGDHPS
jgi:hypothetical protein